MLRGGCCGEGVAGVDWGRVGSIFLKNLALEVITGPDPACDPDHEG